MSNGSIPERIAIIVAMAREIGPLASRWHKVQVGAFPAWESPDGCMRLLCGGIGSRPARQAAEAAVVAFRPELLLSAGFAGSLIPRLKVAALFTASKVIDVPSGAEFDPEPVFSHLPQYRLISVAEVTEESAKLQLANRYAAEAVDMEAAAVAQVAHAHHLRFAVLKAVSEDLEFSFPPIQPFVGEAGEFHTGRFLAHVAMRPAHWSAVRKLRQNTVEAASALCRGLESLEGRPQSRAEVSASYGNSS